MEIHEETMLAENFPATLQAARTGAEWAWTDLYRDVAPSVLGYLRARRAREPEDLTGEVFLQSSATCNRFQGGERDFRAWVFVIAHHRMIDEGRQRARRPVDLVPDVPDVESEAADVETQVIESTAADGVQRVIDRLPPDQRNVLLLRVIGDFTIDEVARTLEKSPGAVKALQRRGVAAIKRTLAGEGIPL